MGKVGLLLILVPLQLLGWGQDLTIYSGPVVCFDVDYRLDPNGTMYLALQKDLSPDYPVEIYTSSDHGNTWQWQAEFDVGGKLERMRLLVADDYVYLFYISPSTDILDVARYDINFDTLNLFMVTAPYSVIKFAVTRDLREDYCLYCVGDLSSAAYEFLWRSCDRGESWTLLDTVQVFANDADAEWPSLAYGPSDFIYETRLSYDIWGGSAFIVTNTWDNYGSNFERYTPLSTYGFSLLSSPHIAASNDPAFPAIWVVYTGIMESPSDTVLMVACYPDSLPPDTNNEWTYDDLASSPYGTFRPDIEFYKNEPNRWVDLVFLERVPGWSYVKWTWSDGSSPSVWGDTITINNHNPDTLLGNSPKLIYSPGAPASGAGVVYAGINGNIYFDAPWVTNVNEGNISIQNPLQFPTLIERGDPLYFSFKKSGNLELSIFDVKGSLCFREVQEIDGGGTLKIPINVKTPGVYFLNVKINGEVIGRSKFELLP